MYSLTGEMPAGEAVDSAVSGERWRLEVRLAGEGAGSCMCDLSPGELCWCI